LSSVLTLRTFLVFTLLLCFLSFELKNTSFQVVNWCQLASCEIVFFGFDFTFIACYYSYLSCCLFILQRQLWSCALRIFDKLIFLLHLYWYTLKVKLENVSFHVIISWR
jgi:hypothetical protein